MGVREEMEAAADDVYRGWQSQMRIWFAEGRYDMMAYEYCHEGLQITDSQWLDTDPIDCRWFDVGICSYSKQVIASHLPPKWQEGNPYELIHEPISSWPPEVVQAVREVAEHILVLVEAGSEGC